MYFRTAEPLENGTQDEIYKALDYALRIYNNGGYTVREIECNGEFKPLMNRVKDDLGVTINYSNAQDHVPAAERNN